MKKLNTTAIFLIAAMAVTFAVLGVYLFFFSAMKEKAESATELSARAEDIQTRREKLSLTLTSLKEQEANIEKLDGYFIKERDIVAFTKSLESLGKNTGSLVSIESLTPQRAKDNTWVLGIRIEASGTFGGLMRLLELFENFPAKIEWGTVRISREGTGAVSSEKIGKVILPGWKLAMEGTAFNFIRE